MSKCECMLSQTKVISLVFKDQIIVVKSLCILKAKKVGCDVVFVSVLPLKVCL